MEGNDPEGQYTIQTALKMLHERYSALRVLSEEKNAELQVNFLL